MLQFLEEVCALTKIRLKFSKGEEVKYISHLDLLRTFQRAIKRAGIPINYSQGFNPHPIMSFALPLSVGTTSESEYMEMELKSEIKPQQIVDQLNEVLPKGIEIIKVEIVNNNSRKDFGLICMADYNVKIELKNAIAVDVKTELKKMLHTDEILIEKKTKKGKKEINIIPLIHELDVQKQDGNYIEFHLKLSAGSKANLKVDLVLQAFNQHIQGFEVDYAAIHRTELWIDKDGEVLRPIE